VPVKFSFDVGEHDIDFSFNQFWGNLSIAVDGVPRKRDFRIASLQLVKRYELTVGETGRHAVVIEKERKRMFAGFRKQKYRVFIDGQLAQEHEGY
jgi:hypothetical protein